MKFLGGSNNGKRIALQRKVNEVVLPKRKKIKWTPSGTWDDMVQTETYVLTKVKMPIMIPETSDFYVEVREAYVCKGSKVKPATVFKFGDHVETYKMHGY